MPDKISGYVLLDAPSGGSAGQGQRVRFDLSFAAEPEPETVTFLCDYHIFNSIILKLAAFAHIAHKDRQTHSPPAKGKSYLDRSMPFDATNIEVGRGVPSGNIALRILTKQNIPIDVSMSLEGARGLAQKLLDEIGSPPIPAPSKPS